MTHTPLDDHAVMYALAARSSRHRPCIGLVRSFDEAIPAESLSAWAAQLASNPAGFGRRVENPRVPGARRRWVPTAEPPPIRYVAETSDAAQLAQLLEEEISSQPDPSRPGGWRVAAVRTGSERTVVSLWMNHAYGDARSILSTAFDPPGSAEAAASGLPPGPAARGSDTVREMGEVVRRLRTGFQGSVRLGRDVAATCFPGTTRATELPRLRPVVDAWNQRSVAVGNRSGRRTVAFVRVPVEDWEAAAQARGASGNTLLLGVLANLLRGSRLARGEADGRPIRILMPVDLRSRGAGSDDPSANAVAGAMVVVPGGRPAHGDLRELRASARRAIAVVSREAKERPRADPGRPAGMVDAMRLLPDALAYRMAVLAQVADGVASNIGPIPPQVLTLGPHRARETYLLGSPMMTDTTICCGRTGDEVTLGVVADVARQGPGGELTARVAGELAAWGLEASIW